MVGGLNVLIVVVRVMNVFDVARDCAPRRIFSEYGVGDAESLELISRCSIRAVLAAAQGYRFGRAASLVHRRCGSVSPSASALVTPSLAILSSGDCEKR